MKKTSSRSRTRPRAKNRRPAPAAKRAAAVPPGSQTLIRGLALIDAVAAGSTDVHSLSRVLGTTRSTTYRLASVLAHLGYLRHAQNAGYALGPKLIELGFRARDALGLRQAARPHLEHLARSSADTVHLGILDGSEVLYLEKVSGQRRLEISSRIGERMPVWSTGLGKALILDQGEADWRKYFNLGKARGPKHVTSVDAWLLRMRDYAKRGYTFDLEENEPQVRCVAAPVRDATGHVVAAISISSTLPYMDDARIAALIPDVCAAAREIGKSLGWSGATRDQQENPSRRLT